MLSHYTRAVISRPRDSNPRYRFDSYLPFLVGFFFFRTGVAGFAAFFFVALVVLLALVVAAFLAIMFSLRVKWTPACRAKFSQDFCDLLYLPVPAFFFLPSRAMIYDQLA